jgi:hypothetical protein
MPVLGSGLSAYTVLAAGGSSNWTSVMPQPWLAAAGGVCAIAALVWARAAARLARAARRIEEETLASGTSSEAANLARSGFNKDLHAAVLYAVLAAGLVLASFSTSAWFEVLLLAVSVPAVFSLRYAPRFLAEARLAEQRSRLERRAEEVLAQEDLAPRRWAARLAPETLPTYDGFDIGWVYEPGTGMMAGDFYDVFPTSPERLAVVIGDVAGHGIEPSITAFQVKHVLRIFLRQYRTPPRPSRSSIKRSPLWDGPRTWFRVASSYSTPRLAPCAMHLRATPPPSCGNEGTCVRCGPPGPCSR